MMVVPPVCVLIPVYNGARFVVGALRSLQRQTIEDLEIVVIDDGSTDATPKLVQEVAASDARVRLLRREHEGISAALNAGLRATRAEWVARLDADDEALPERLARQLAAAARDPSVVVWASWALTVDVEGRIIGEVRTGPVTQDEFRQAHADGRVEILHPTVLARRDVLLEAGGYDSRFDGAEDVELWDRVGEIGSILTIPEPLILFRAHPASTSTVGMGDTLRIQRYVAARRRAHDAGRTLSWEAFADAESTAPLLRRTIRELSVRGAVEYRRAGVAYADSMKLRAGLHLLLAAGLQPAYVLLRLWRQVLRPRLRRRDVPS